MSSCRRLGGASGSRCGLLCCRVQSGKGLFKIARQAAGVARIRARLATALLYFGTTVVRCLHPGTSVLCIWYVRRLSGLGTPSVP